FTGNWQLATLKSSPRTARHGITAHIRPERLVMPHLLIAVERRVALLGGGGNRAVEHVPHPGRMRLGEGFLELLEGRGLLLVARRRGISTGRLGGEHPRGG